jgi:hypothetical protein|eukprot:COSAG01_NODE_9073_length_2564_cov_2.011765_3_plen_90_part_00
MYTTVAQKHASAAKALCRHIWFTSEKGVGELAALVEPQTAPPPGRGDPPMQPFTTCCSRANPQAYIRGSAGVLLPTLLWGPLHRERCCQ